MVLANFPRMENKMYKLIFSDNEKNMGEVGVFDDLEGAADAIETHAARHVNEANVLCLEIDEDDDGVDAAVALGSNHIRIYYTVAA